MDKIIFYDLKIPAKIGVYPWEKKITRTLHLDLEIAVNHVKVAALHDDIHYALDYGIILNRIIQFVAEKEITLIETLAEKIAQLLLDEFDISWLRLRLKKLRVFDHLPAVAIELERSKESV